MSDETSYSLPCVFLIVIRVLTLLNRHIGQYGHCDFVLGLYLLLAEDFWFALGLWAVLRANGSKRALAEQSDAKM